jgi:hypothetical protein
LSGKGTALIQVVADATGLGLAQQAALILLPALEGALKGVIVRPPIKQDVTNASRGQKGKGPLEARLERAIANGCLAYNPYDK